MCIPVLLAVLAVAVATVLALALPGAALGDTSLPPGGLVKPTPPEPSPLDALLGLVQPILVLGFGLWFLWGVVHLVADIGPEPSPAASEGDPVSSGPRLVPSGRHGGLGLLVTGAVAVAGGGLLGRSIAYASSVGGLGGALGAGLYSLVAGSIVVALVVIAGLALAMRRGQATAAIRTVLLSAGLLVVGLVGGGATAGLTGGLYHEPVFREEAAEVMQLTLSPTQPAYTPRQGFDAFCQAIPDGQQVASIYALDVGELGTVRLDATMSLTAGGSGSDVYLSLEPADLFDLNLPENKHVAVPSWEGPVSVRLTDPLGLAGSATFDAPAVPSTEGIPTVAPAAGAWPAHLAGQLTWTCAPWAPSAVP